MAEEYLNKSGLEHIIKELPYRLSSGFKLFGSFTVQESDIGRYWNSYLDDPLIKVCTLTYSSNSSTNHTYAIKDLYGYFHKLELSYSKSYWYTSLELTDPIFVYFYAKATTKTINYSTIITQVDFYMTPRAYVGTQRYMIYELNDTCLPDSYTTYKSTAETTETVYVDSYEKFTNKFYNQTFTFSDSTLNIPSGTVSKADIDAMFE